MLTIKPPARTITGPISWIWHILILTERAYFHFEGGLLIQRFINEIEDKFNEFKLTKTYHALDPFWNIFRGKYRKIAIGGTAIFLVMICCLCNLITSPNKSDLTQVPTYSTTDVAATIYAEIDISTQIAATIIAGVEQTQQAISTPTIAVTSTITVSPTKVQSNDNLKISFIDVGQGDAILIRSPEGLFGLIDGGEQDSGVVEYLQDQGIQSLDLVVATHPHSDHIGGLIEVLNTFPIARVVTNGEMHTTLIYESFLDAIATSKAEYIEVTRGESVYLGSLNLEVLNPGLIIEGDQNRNSIVLSLTYGNTTSLFTGDATKDTEAEMIAAGLLLEADILKVGHHGSNSATSSEFVALVQPEVAVYSAGKGNSYGHPNPDTLARLSDAGAQVFGTDVNGTIIFEIDETGYSIQTTKEGLAVPIADPNTIPDSQADLQEEISISVVSLNSPISAGNNAKLTIQTVPGAVCSITVYYKSGPSSAAGLGSQTADASGQATWSWKVGSRTTPGMWEIVVQSNLNNKSASISIPFEVK